MIKITTRAFPCALPPTEAELAARRALSRDEQLISYCEPLQAPDAARATTATMTDVLAAARQFVSARRG
jgi:hypothetical protein